MNSVSERKHDVPDTAGSEGDTDASVIERLRRFHYGEPAAAANTTLPAA
jgi:hypothetical protein